MLHAALLPKWIFHRGNSTSICGRQSPRHRRVALPRFEELPSTVQGTRNIFHYCSPSCAGGGDRSQKAAMRWNEFRTVRKVLRAGIIAPSSSGGEMRAGEQKPWRRNQWPASLLNSQRTRKLETRSWRTKTDQATHVAHAPLSGHAHFALIFQFLPTGIFF